MMIPIAYVSHEVDHRIRLRIPNRRGSAEYFERLERDLLKCDGIEKVETNPLTASVVIRHHVRVPEIGAYSRKAKLFSLKRQLPAEGSLGQRASSRLDHFDSRIRHSTSGQVDLRSVNIVMLLTLSAYQAFQGRWLPPAWTLFQNALAELRDPYF